MHVLHWINSSRFPSRLFGSRMILMKWRRWEFKRSHSMIGTRFSSDECRDDASNWERYWFEISEWARMNIVSFPWHENDVGIVCIKLFSCKRNHLHVCNWRNHCMLRKYINDFVRFIIENSMLLMSTSFLLQKKIMEMMENTSCLTMFRVHG